MLYREDNRFFLDNFEPKYPNDSVPTILNSPIKDSIEKLYHSKNNKISVLIFTKTNGFVHGEAIKEGTKLITMFIIISESKLQKKP